MNLLAKVGLMCVLVAAFFGALEFFDPSPWKPLPGSGSSIVCRDFDYPTTRGDRDVVCRLLWCEQAVGAANRGGPTALWCEPADAAVAPVQAVAASTSGRWW